MPDHFTRVGLEIELIPLAPIVRSILTNLAPKLKLLSYSTYSSLTYGILVTFTAYIVGGYYHLIAYLSKLI